MTPLAVTLSLVWLVTAFALRIAIQLRRTGDSGLRIRSSEPVATLAKVLFTSATLAVGLAPMFEAAGWIDVVDDLRSPPSEVVGVALAVAGIAATFVAQLAMGRSWRIGVDPEERTDLVTDGVFAIVRNPIFSTMLVTSVGFVLLLPTAVGLVGLVVMVVALEIQVRGVEEPYLRTVHGAAYDAYVARVGRFVPRRFVG